MEMTLSPIWRVAVPCVSSVLFGLIVSYAIESGRHTFVVFPHFIAASPTCLGCQARIEEIKNGVYCAHGACRDSGMPSASPIRQHDSGRSLPSVGCAIIAVSAVATVINRLRQASPRCFGFTLRSRARAPTRHQHPRSVGQHAEPLMPWKIPNHQQWQWLSVREILLRERICMITEYIDESYANSNMAMLLYLQSEDAVKPVQIYISSSGASLKPALALYDTICQLKAGGCTVTTVCHSLCAGMSAFLVASGSPGRRFVTPNAVIRLAQTGLENSMQGQAADIAVEAIQVLQETARVEEELAKMTGNPLEAIKKDLKRAFYLSAASAVNYGLVDSVLIPRSDKGAKLDLGSRDPWSGVVTRSTVGFGIFADPNQPRTAI
eukprot:TRINITY_DN43381_c0_g1_i1.p1 TRINITY_DN43381_c0_g1~~TRINITY_DN43381_c0_g1_i1.p1  ORF type:complete len:379 (-),score=35.60 TRINITY_DN43381_c0_g1_i1:56-1192(-)